MVKRAVPPLSFDQMQALITRIYDAALDENYWETVLNTLAFSLHAERASMRMLNGKSKRIQHAHIFNVDPIYTQAYIDHYVNYDPCIDIALNSQGLFLACSHHLISDKEYEAMEFYQDFVKPQDNHYGMGGRIDIHEDSACYMTFQRGKKHEGFDLHYLATLKSLAPHIKQAVLINEKMQRVKVKNDLLSGALNQINSPVCLVTKYGSIIYINEIAEQLIARHDGVSIKNNSIFIHAIRENKQLLDLIRCATRKNYNDQLTHGGAMCYTNPKSHSSLSILVSPVNPDKTNLGTQNHKVALILFNTSDHRVSLTIDLLMGLYKMTPAEAKLCLYLCEGLSLDEISIKLSRSKNTLRSQLRSSFNKVGVSRQSELIHLINTGHAGIIKSK
jgi:DNA-binding CsgD family transcriptional regulator/PAS domain-containing protein